MNRAYESCLAGLSAIVAEDRVVTSEQRLVLLEKLQWIGDYVRSVYGRQYELSCDPDYDLTLEHGLKAGPAPPDADPRTDCSGVLMKKEGSGGNGARLAPYAKLRNLADPFGELGVEGGSLYGIEAGIRIRF